MACRVVCLLLLATVFIQGTIAVPDYCSMEPETGNCKMAAKRWFFNSTTNKCEIFIYGGCGGNDNNFEKRKACERKCHVCPVHDCPLDSPSCPNGYKKDKKGCETCECSGPCKNHKCPPGEKCMDTLMVPGAHCINIKENRKTCNKVCMDFCNKEAPMIADLPCPPCECPEDDACDTMLCPEGKTCKSKVVCSGKFKCRSKGRCVRGKKETTPCKEGKPEWNTTHNANKFCGRGPNREECSTGYECVIAPDDSFAVCCPKKDAAFEMGDTIVDKVCPALPPGTIGTCDVVCGNDSDCTEGEKCCSYGCGVRCMTAVDPEKK